MSTLAKVIRFEAAAAIAAFRPNELGAGTPAAGTGVQAFSFPSVETMPVPTVAQIFAQTFAPTADLHPVIQQEFIDVEPMPHEINAQERAAIERSLREEALADARATIENEVGAQTAEMRNTLAQSLAQISGVSEDLAAKMEADVVELAFMIAKKVITREVTIDREIVVNVTRAALAKLHSRSIASVRLNPDDLAYVREHRDKLNFHGSLELVEDRTISPGGCLVHTDAGDIDGRLESQFDEIAHALLGENAN